MASIKVYALLPLTLAQENDNDRVALDNWNWIHCLTLPLENLNALHVSQWSYKWIRYSIGVVVGAIGSLSTSSDPHSWMNYVVGYNDSLPDHPIHLYYHINDEEKRRIFPLDPDIARASITSSATTSRRHHFRDDVAERDGGRCVLSGITERYCDAVHLLAHSKGDSYIYTYTRHRSRDPTGGDIIEHIDNVRNGLFLNKFSHVALGNDLAFLMTPNFAMDTSDIDPTAPQAEQRCTAHLFRPDELEILGNSTLGPGSPLRISDTPDWPPPILFDAIYASAVLYHFGTRELKDEVSARWENIFYPDKVMSAAQADNKRIKDERAAEREKGHIRGRQRAERLQTRRGPDTFDMLMVLPYVLIPPDQLQTALREADDRAKAAERKRLTEKVEAWMEHIPPAL